jgi:hypothetical protein
MFGTSWVVVETGQPEDNTWDKETVTSATTENLQANQINECPNLGKKHIGSLKTSEVKMMSEFRSVVHNWICVLKYIRSEIFGSLFATSS